MAAAGVARRLPGMTATKTESVTSPDSLSARAAAKVATAASRGVTGTATASAILRASLFGAAEVAAVGGMGRLNLRLRRKHTAPKDWGLHAGPHKQTELYRGLPQR